MSCVFRIQGRVPTEWTRTRQIQKYINNTYTNKDTKQVFNGETVKHKNCSKPPPSNPKLCTQPFKACHNLFQTTDISLHVQVYPSFKKLCRTSVVSLCPGSRASEQVMPADWISWSRRQSLLLALSLSPWRRTGLWQNCWQSWTMPLTPSTRL